MPPIPPVARARVSRRRGAVLALLASLSVGAIRPAVAQSAPVPSAGPSLVLVVRHAEKADNSDDPVLSAAGTARAEALAEALRDARVDHVIVTHRQRTRLTAGPVLAARGLTPEVVPFGRSMTEHVAAVAEAVRRRRGEVVLVVGHSNTVPMIVHALGGPRLPDLCDARYAALFAVVPGAPEGGRLVVSSFGAADPPTALTCAGMVPR